MEEKHFRNNHNEVKKLKEKFGEINFHKKTLMLHDSINAIVGEYQRKGMRLSLRQLYYQLVSRGVIPNNATEYDKIKNTVSGGRMCGRIDWDAIEDRTRVPHTPGSFKDIPQVIQAAKDCYRLDRQAGQPLHLELSVEKDAVSQIVAPIADKYGITLMINRGYPSKTALYNASKRYIRQDKECIIIYGGDLDPSGADMDRNIVDSLKEMHADVKVERVALLPTQTTNLIPCPVKDTDSRAVEFKKQYGNNGWEVDALPPETLAYLFEKAIISKMNMRLYEDVLKREAEDREKLSLLANSIKEEK